MGTISGHVKAEKEQKITEYCKNNNCNRSDFVNRAVDVLLQNAGTQLYEHTNAAAAKPTVQETGTGKYYAGYCRGYHIDPETGIKILSRPARVASDDEIKSMML